MKTGKNISTLFREGSQQLQVQPSGQAWNELERRLERHGRQGRVVVMRWVAAIAAMMVLVAGAYFWNISMQAKNTFARLDGAVPQQLEDLENTDGCEPFCLVLQARKELPAYYANPVQKTN